MQMWANEVAGKGAGRVAGWKGEDGVKTNGNETPGRRKSSNFPFRPYFRKHIFISSTLSCSHSDLMKIHKNMVLSLGYSLVKLQVDTECTPFYLWQLKQLTILIDFYLRR